MLNCQALRASAVAADPFPHFVTPGLGPRRYVMLKLLHGRRIAGPRVARRRWSNRVTGGCDLRQRPP
jgi:hypothetical protein